MAAEEVIHFPFWAQLSRRPNSPILSAPEPVAKPPPLAETEQMFISCDQISDRCAIRVPRRHSQRSSGVANEWGRSKETIPNSDKWSSNDEIRRIQRDLSLESERGSIGPSVTAFGVAVHLPETRAKGIRTPARRNPCWLECQFLRNDGSA